MAFTASVTSAAKGNEGGTGNSSLVRLTYSEVGALRRGPITVNDALRLCYYDYTDDKALIILESLAINMVYVRTVFFNDAKIGVISGTRKFAQWRMYNLAFWPSLGHGDTRQWHRGFLEYAQTAYAFLKGKGVDAVCGHSLGGAAGQIVGPSLKVPSICLSSPRVLINGVDKNPDVLNVIRRDDVIPKLPLMIPGLYHPAHVGRVIGFRPRRTHRGEDHKVSPLASALSGYETGDWTYTP